MSETLPQLADADGWTETPPAERPTVAEAAPTPEPAGCRHRFAPDPTRLSEGLGLRCVLCGEEAVAACEVPGGGSLADYRMASGSVSALAGAAAAYRNLPRWKRWLGTRAYRQARLTLEGAYRRASALAEGGLVPEDLRVSLQEALLSAESAAGEFA